MADLEHDHWFAPLAAYMGPAYLRYSFTKGAEQEVRAIMSLLGLVEGQRVLDIGCGPGRHAIPLAEAGLDVLGVDISPEFIALACHRAEESGVGDRVSFVCADARRLGPPVVEPGSFDAVISLCQGAFGLSGGPGATSSVGRELDEPIMAAMAAALRPGGLVATSAFSAYFQLRYLSEHDTFDATDGVNHELTTIRNDEGDERSAELWTTCFTPRELRLLARVSGLRPLFVHGVDPGRYGAGPTTIDCAEFLLIAERPGH